MKIYNHFQNIKINQDQKNAVGQINDFLESVFSNCAQRFVYD